MLGLSWIMRYYCLGCASWDWFYPEHYAPLLRDLSAMNNVTVSFAVGAPLSQLEAIIAVGTRSGLHARRARRSTRSSPPRWSDWWPRRSGRCSGSTRGRWALGSGCEVVRGGRERKASALDGRRADPLSRLPAAPRRTAEGVERAPGTAEEEKSTGREQALCRGWERGSCEMRRGHPAVGTDGAGNAAVHMKQSRWSLAGTWTPTAMRRFGGVA